MGDRPLDVSNLTLAVNPLQLCSVCPQDGAVHLKI